MTEEELLMVEDCLNRYEKLSDWENQFLDDISRRAEPLSERQHDKLTQIWERVT